MNNGESEDRGVESERAPKYRFIFTRHAERLPSGVLSETGKQHAAAIGRQYGESAEVLKGYGSDHASKRAIDTANIISEAADVQSPDTEERYKTRTAADLTYAILEPDFTPQYKKTVDLIETGTLQEAGMSTERDEHGKLVIQISKLPLEEQARIALIRQRHQAEGFDYILSQPAMVDRLAMAVGHRFSHELAVARRYQSGRDFQQAEHDHPTPKEDVVMNTVGHGIFPEAFLQRAGVRQKADVMEDGIDLRQPDIGGYLQPLESFSLDVEDPGHVPELIPLSLHRQNGEGPSGLFVSRAKLEDLERQYQGWKKSREAKE